MTEPTNVFEWCWEHSQAVGDDRELLLWLAFRSQSGTVSTLPTISAISTALDKSCETVTASLFGLIDLKEIEVTWAEPGTYFTPSDCYTFPAYETARLPHTLTLGTWNGKPYEGEDAHRWDFIEIECPHQPATETMPCAMWEPCGCPPDTTEAPLDDGGDGDGRGPCSKSAIGQHCYIEGEPNRPVASCFGVDREAEIAERAFELGLMPGTHLVRPWWDGDAVQLELVEPQVVRHG